MLSHRLSDLRRKKGLTQNEVSELLNVRQGSYSNWENGKREPDIEMIKKIARLYKVSTDYLLENEEYTKENILAKFDRQLNEEERQIILNVCKSIYPEKYKKIEDSN